MVWRGYFTEFQLPEKVVLFDTTLRDGEQTPGVALTPEDKLKIARQLDILGVPVIEAGFPVTSPGEEEAVRKIVKEGLKAEITALARASKQDIEKVASTGAQRIHLFIATSDIHLNKKLKISREEAIKRAVEAIDLAKSYGMKIEFSAEDATRTNLDFLVEFYKTVEEAGANIVDIPDTVGVATPFAMREIVRRVREALRIPIAIHCHNDMGLAVANTLAGIEGGATEAHVTVNGLGERAGNASLEEVAVSLKVLYGVETGINFKEIYDTSRMVSSITGITIPVNKPIVGENAFSHESGIHTHGIISSPETYEPIDPEFVGTKRRIVAGKHAGTHGISAQLKEMGYTPTEEELNKIVKIVKEMGDQGKKVTDAELASIAESVMGYGISEKERIELDEFMVVTGLNITPTATIKIRWGDQSWRGAEFGVGPIDASIKAVGKLLGDLIKIKLESFRLEAITGGTEAFAEVTVRVSDEGGRSVTAKGFSKDIVLAGVYAILNGANRLIQIRKASAK
ncbi:MAG: 2-isopropylmalate synthase [Thermoproteota archaeon]|nr:2-isopropylmalate synthase [Candidatus Brockarchaeota archaeon]